MSEMNIWARFDTIADVTEVNEAKTKFTPVEAGKYRAMLEKIEAKESKQGLPMLSTMFRLENNRVVFSNQNIQNLSNPEMTATNIAKAVAFVSSVIGEPIEYKGLANFADIISTIECGKYYDIEITYGKKDVDMSFPNIRILPTKEDIASDGFMNIEDGIDDLPFN